MPLYEYQCTACGHRFEKIQKFADPPIKVCPNCGKRKVSKLVSAPGFQFKGSGWYVTDYAKSNAAGASASEAKPESSDSTPDKAGKDGSKVDATSASTSEAKSDTKSDAKTASKAKK